MLFVATHQQAAVVVGSKFQNLTLENELSKKKWACCKSRTENQIFFILEKNIFV